MADYRAEARRVAKRHGLDPDIFERQIGQESGFNPHAKSPAGALGIAQIMPATAKAWGVDPSDPVASLDAAARSMAHYVRQFGSYDKALRAYNAGPGNVDESKGFAETNAYVKAILGGRDPKKLDTPSGSSSGSALLEAAGGSQPQGVPQGSEGILSLLQALDEQKQQPVASSAGVQAPAFSAAPAMPQGVQTPVSGGGPQPGPDMDALLALVKQSGADTGTVPDQSGVTVQASGGGGGGGGSSSRAAHGGLVTFDGKKVASWIAPLLEYARDKGWKGTVTSGYRSDAEQKAIYDRGTRPAAKPISEGGGGSNHSRTGFLQGALDVTDPAALDRILKRKHSRLKYAGAKDPVHFSVPRNGTY